MDFSMPASQLTICPLDKFLIAACQDGSIVLYTINDLSLQNKCTLHSTSSDSAEGAGSMPHLRGCTSAVMVEGNVLLTSGADRVFNLVEMVPGSVAAAAASRRMAQKPHKGIAVVDSVATSGLKSWPNVGVSEPLSSGAGLQDIDLYAAKAMTWIKSRCEMLREP